MREETKILLLEAWDFVDVNEYPDDEAIKFMAESAKVDIDTVLNFRKTTTPEERIKYSQSVDMFNTFKGINHGKGKIQIDTSSPGKVEEFKPIEIHLKEDGDINNEPSVAIVMRDLSGNKVFGQLSLRMLAKGLHEVGYKLIRHE